MTALVSQHPEAGPEEALNEGVHAPQKTTKGNRRNVLWRQIGVKEIECGSKRSNIASDIAKAFGCGSLETMCWNGVSDLLDGEVWELELVAICVDQLSVPALQLELTA